MQHASHMPGKHRMHQLYLHYLACKGVWRNCSLIISVKKTMQNQRRELYEFWDYKTMTERLGKDLADDLVRRHTEAEERLPQHQKGSFIIKSLVFASTFLAQTNKACATQCAQVYTHTHVLMHAVFQHLHQGILTSPIKWLCGATRTLWASLRRRNGNMRRRRSTERRLKWKKVTFLMA